MVGLRLEEDSTLAAELAKEQLGANLQQIYRFPRQISPWVQSKELAQVSGLVEEPELQLHSHCMQPEVLQVEKHRLSRRLNYGQNGLALLVDTADQTGQDQDHWVLSKSLHCPVGFLELYRP